MIPTLYEPFRHWSDSGSVYILSDLHFDDEDCKFMNPGWITPEEQLAIINKMVMKGDTFVCLGDVDKEEQKVLSGTVKGMIVFILQGIVTELQRRIYVIFLKEMILRKVMYIRVVFLKEQHQCMKLICSCVRV